MYYDYNMTSSNATGGLLELTGTVLIPALIIGAVAIVAMWKLFEKAGKEGWIAIIPFYNTYTLFEITWGNGWLFLLMLLAIIPIIGWIAVIVIAIITMLKLGKAFNCSGGFIAGLILLSPIFLCILGFSKDYSYGGVPKKDTESMQPPVAPKEPIQTENTNTEPTQNIQPTTLTPEPTPSVLSQEPTPSVLPQAPIPPAPTTDTTTPTEVAVSTMNTIPTAPEPMKEATPVSFCQNCGAQLPEGTAFCPNCGTPKAS